MVANIINGIAAELKKAFPLCAIYTEEIKQEVEKPYFFIECISSSKKLFLGKKYKIEQKFSIKYFSKTQTNEENYNVSSELFNILEYINDGTGLTRGTNMNSSITNGVLQFLINYNMFIYMQDENSENMEVLEINGKAKK